MARRSILVAVAALAALAALAPAGASAATAPAAAPVLTSAPFTVPVRIHWTPANDPLNVSQSVYRGDGACTSPVTEGGLITHLPRQRARPTSPTTTRATASTATTSRSPTCSTTAEQPRPHGRRRHAEPDRDGRGREPGRRRRQRHRRPSRARAADAVSGVASSVFHVGAAGACASGPVVGATWDTTTVAKRRLRRLQRRHRQRRARRGRDHDRDRRERRCGPRPRPRPPARQRPGGTVTGASPRRHRRTGPRRRKLVLTLPRAKAAGDPLRPRLHWIEAEGGRPRPRGRRAQPQARAARARATAPRSTAASARRSRSNCGRVRPATWRSSRTTTAATSPSRRARCIAPAALIPLRPLSGSVVRRAPRLTWKARAGSAYYNVQLFRNGKRVLVGWPSRASYDVPAGHARARHVRLVRMAGRAQRRLGPDVRRPHRARHLRRQGVAAGEA